MTYFPPPEPRVNLTQGDTTTREWWRFFANLFNIARDADTSITSLDGQIEGRITALEDQVGALVAAFGAAQADRSGEIADIAASVVTVRQMFDDAVSRLDSLLPDVPVYTEDIAARLDSLATQTAASLDDIASRLDSLATTPPIALGTLGAQNYDRVSITGGTATLATESVGTLTVTSDNGYQASGQTSDVGGQTATFTNAPTAGNPAFYLRVRINATNYAIPCLTA